MKQLKGILDDLLDTARAQHGKLQLQRQPVDLATLIGAALADHARMQPRWDRGDHGALIVDGDPVRLRQILDNLIDNAFKYGGRNVTIHTATAAGHATLVVQDDGQGIAPDLLPRLFEPFVQGEHSPGRGGLGLGLALVQHLVQLHDGQVQVHSDGPGRGSRFTVTLPLALARSTTATAMPSPAVAQPLRILLVDDEADVRDTTRTLLELQGHRVTVAAEGAQALARLEQHDFDVALIDLGLPGISGYDLAERMRARAPSLRLIAVSGHGQAADRARALASGFDEHMIKPVALDDLRSVLASGRQARRDALVG